MEAAPLWAQPCELVWGWTSNVSPPATRTATGHNDNRHHEGQQVTFICTLAPPGFRACCRRVEPVPAIVQIAQSCNGQDLLGGRSRVAGRGSSHWWQFPAIRADLLPSSGLAGGRRPLVQGQYTDLQMEKLTTLATGGFHNITMEMTILSKFKIYISNCSLHIQGLEWPGLMFGYGLAGLIVFGWSWVMAPLPDPLTLALRRDVDIGWLIPYTMEVIPGVADPHRSSRCVLYLCPYKQACDQPIDPISPH